MLQKGFHSFAYQIIGAVMAFALQFIAAGMLSAEEFGKFNVYYGYIGSIGVLYYLGLPFYLPKITHKFTNPNEALSSSYSLVLVAFLISAPFLLLYLNYSVGNVLLSILILLGALGFALIEILKSFFFGVGNPVLATKTRMVFMNGLAIAGFFVCVWLLDEVALSVLLPLVIAYFAVTLYYSSKRFTFVKPEWSFIKAALPFYAVQVLYLSYAYLSRVVQEYFQNYTIVAVLSVALIVRTLIVMMGATFSNMLLPEFSKAWDNKEISKITELFKKMTRINVYIVFPIILLLCTSASRFLSLFGAEYVGNEIILILIIVSAAVTVFVGPNGTVLLMTGNEKKEIFNGVLLLVVAIIGSLILGPRWEYGIALTVMLAEICVAISKRIMTYRLLSISSFKLSHLLMIFLFGLIQAAIFLAIEEIGHLVPWLILAGMATLFFAFTNLWFSPFKEDRLFLLETKTALIKKITG